MTAVVVPETFAVAKRRNDKPPKPTGQPSTEPPFDRVEFQAPPGWVRLLDAAADALGISRSAYIRMACNRQMNADRGGRVNDAE